VAAAFFFYNASKGLGATATLNGEGKYNFVSEIPGFATGWDRMIGTVDGGILFYNSSTGLGATATLDNAGHYKFVGQIPEFAKGWTDIGPPPANNTFGPLRG
jgi:hypothetical protein